MTYNSLARKIVTKVTNEYITGYPDLTPYLVRSDLDLNVLALYIQRRAPRAHIIQVLGKLNNRTIYVRLL